ncbi:MAG: precorrin-6A reductase [Planctomycetaceae bacterium]|jgi:precorrin-2 dehydrogenase/sirohydrochlorin ferrochelatase/precorrin-6A/cobalt-precorrin-6A reductase|nr:precorrin-6A reductase [Planctomycetaceae bacterium]
MMNVLIFGGTTESGKLAQLLADQNVNVTLIVATDYAKNLFTEPLNFTIIAQRLGETEMIHYLKTHSFDYVVDATHPYADLATRNIHSACRNVNVQYLRLLRNESDKYDKNSSVTYISHPDEGINLLNCETGNILFTIGSKELTHFVNVKNFASRSFVRILPMMDSLKKTVDLGFRNSNIICIQGAVSEEMNRAMINMTQAKFLVTKDSGTIGGFDAKISAAQQCGCRVLVLMRPEQETGFFYAELLDFFHIKENTVSDINKNFQSVTNNPSLLKLVERKENRQSFFPLFTNLYNKNILVIGGGNIAQRRIEILYSFGATIKLISPSVTEELQKMIQQQYIHFVNKEYEKDDIDYFHPLLVIAATNSREVNHRVAQDAKEKDIFVIVSDCRDECNCYFPAIMESESFLAGLVSKKGDHHGVRTKAEQIRELLNDNDNSFH